MSVPPWDFGKTRDKSGNPIVGYQRTDSVSSPRWRKRAEGRQAGFTWVVWARGGGGQGKVPAKTQTHITRYQPEKPWC